MKWFISMRKLWHGDEMTSIGDEKPSILQGYLGIYLQCLQYDFCIWEILETLIQEDLLTKVGIEQCWWLWHVEFGFEIWKCILLLIDIDSIWHINRDKIGIWTYSDILEIDIEAAGFFCIICVFSWDVHQFPGPEDLEGESRMVGSEFTLWYTYKKLWKDPPFFNGKTHYK